MDISDTLAPTSDQLDAIDLTAGPRIFTVKSVSKGSDEQPVQVHLVEFPKPWRPGKNMRRVLAACWGVDASAWAGHRVELYRDPDVTFGKETPGGTRISRLSHIEKEQMIPLLVSRGKSATFTVQPLSAPAGKAPASGVVPPIDPTQPPTSEVRQFLGEMVEDGLLGVKSEDPAPNTTTKALLAGMSAHQKAELYQRCGIERSSNLTAVKSKLCAAYLEFDWINVGDPSPDEPDPVAVLAEFQRLDRENRPADGVEEFERFAKTGEDLDAGGQATLDAEAAL